MCFFFHWRYNFVLLKKQLFWRHIFNKIFITYYSEYLCLTSEGLIMYRYDKKIYFLVLITPRFPPTYLKIVYFSSNALCDKLPPKLRIFFCILLLNNSKSKKVYFRWYIFYFCSIFPLFTLKFCMLSSILQEKLTWLKSRDLQCWLIIITNLQFAFFSYSLSSFYLYCIILPVLFDKFSPKLA